MEKLHQLIATKKHIDDGFEKIFSETIKIMGKPDKMQGLSKKYSPFDDDGQKFPDDSKEIVTTVQNRIMWFAKHAASWVNFRLARDRANSEAKSTFEFNGIEFKDIPVSTLLEMEDFLSKKLRPVYDNIPTRDMTKTWEKTEKEHIFKHGPTLTYKSTKITTPVILYEATKEHPAQIKEVVEDKQIGQIETVHFSGEESSQFKADCLANLDGLLMAIKKARCKANETEVTHEDIGAKVFAAIHSTQGGLRD